jgi:membrane-bound lytic murein transglycosylase D
MVLVARVSDEFPVVVNQRVLKWLNYYIGTPDGREGMRNALARMETYRPLVQKKLAQYRVPVELAAIPITESGYKNQPQSPNVEHGAGLWMFIQSTARKYGMRVDDKVDERLVPEIETDAAMRYFVSNKDLFNDWRLSVLAYNAGEQSIKAAIDKTGSKDPWGLVDSGLLSRETTEYLPKLMAAILIMRNSGSIQ